MLYSSQLTFRHSGLVSSWDCRNVRYKMYLSVTFNNLSQSSVKLCLIFRRYKIVMCKNSTMYTDDETRLKTPINALCTRELALPLMLKGMMKRVIKKIYMLPPISIQSRCHAATYKIYTRHARHKGSCPFQIVGVDFWGSIRYRVSKETENNDCMIHYTGSLTRALYFEFTKSMETKEFLRTFKRLIASQGIRPA